jgi:outer membrane receptor protein involved in Fe transport
LPADAQDEPLEQIVVTGSRIARPDFESASPVFSIAAEKFEETGSASVDTVLNRLPQFVPDFTSTSNNPGNGGQGNVQLRGLGTTSTLVLLDGRRLVPANGNGVVDVNVIPPSLIERVEIVTGGASAVYGSDAVAGVVNFRLRDDFDGWQLDGGGAQTERGDGTEYSVGLTAGHSFADGRGHVVGYVGYTDRDAVMQYQRRFSRYALGYVGPGAGVAGPDDSFTAQGSSTLEEGRPDVRGASFPAFQALLASYGYAACVTDDNDTSAGCVPYQTQFGVNDDRTLFTQGTFDPGSVANFRGEQDPLLYNELRYTYNYAPFNALQLPLDRASIFGRGTFELEGGTELYVQGLYTDYSADQVLAPTPAEAIVVPVSNPYLPTDLKFLAASRDDPGEPIIVQKRMSAVGPRIASNQYDVYQVTAGASGPVGETWKFDAYAQYGENSQEQRQTGNTLRSLIDELAAAPDGGASICGEFDLFRTTGISPGCADYISFTGVNRAGYEQTVIELSVSGSPWQTPAADVHVVLGAMYKRDQYFYKADPLSRKLHDDGSVDVEGFAATDDIEGSDYNTDLYVEALVPLLADQPAAQRLELVLGYRYSQYQSAGGVDAWKAELVYQPLESLRLRASTQQAVRAPSVYELYLPRLSVWWNAEGPFDPLVDPCEVTSAERNGPDQAQVEALCLTQGVPAALMATFDDGDGVHRGVYGGNPDLGPETAATLTLGFVVSHDFENAWADALQVSVDWYRIKLDDAIRYVFINEFVPRCFDAATNPDFVATNDWCGFFARNSTTGEITGYQEILVNIEGYQVSGMDTQIDWAATIGPGTAKVNLLASWLSEFKLLPAPGVPATDQVGYVGSTVGGALPEWKINVNLGYEWSGWSLGAQWRFIDSMLDRDISLDYSIASQDYIDFNATYEFGPGALAGLTMRAGVENLEDEQPPLVPSSIAANTDPSQYDVLGRRYYINLTYRF